MRLTHQILLARAITFASVVAPRVASAAEHVIEMRNHDDAGNHMAFQPGFVKVEVGDTVKFVPPTRGITPSACQIFGRKAFRRLRAM
ncbi:MAG TPA: hypothetical protein VIF39_11605 [Hyphomicrobium sp.]|jgi:plastocyanin